MDQADFPHASTISDETKGFVRQALESHINCAHENPHICHTLTLVEVELLREEQLTEEQVHDCEVYIYDQVMEGLILKGLVEPFGIDLETGDFIVGLTDAGEQAAIDNGLITDDESGTEDPTIDTITRPIDPTQSH